MNIGKRNCAKFKSKGGLYTSPMIMPSLVLKKILECIFLSDAPIPFEQKKNVVPSREHRRRRVCFSKIHTLP